MSKMANEYNAINLSQGFPDFSCSEQLIELVHHFMKNGHNQYAPMPGTVELRKQISLKVSRDYDTISMQKRSNKLQVQHKRLHGISAIIKW
jgi:methionine aminotransferase